MLFVAREPLERVHECVFAVLVASALNRPMMAVCSGAFG
jgi:hypothetical protein